MDVTIRSDASRVLAEHRAALKRRPAVIRSLLAREGRLFVRDVVRGHQSGRPGLRRRTLKQDGAAGGSHRLWVVVARIEADGQVRLVVGNQRAYLRFHTDTYVPKGLPRRNPVRLPTGRLWTERMTGPALAAAIARAGFADAAPEGGTGA